LIAHRVSVPHRPAGSGRTQWSWARAFRPASIISDDLSAPESPDHLFRSMSREGHLLRPHHHLLNVVVPGYLSRWTG